MKSVKRILAVIMAVAFVLTTFSVCAFAADEEQTEPQLKVTLSTDKESYEPGDTVTVNVDINTNFNYTTFRFPIMFDSSIYEAPALLKVTSYNTVKNNGDIKSNVNGTEFIPADYSTSDWGCVVVQWTAAVASGEVKVLNTNGQDERAFSFQLKVAEEAPRGETGTIMIPSEYNGFYTQAITDPTDATTLVYLKDTLKMEFVPANAAVADVNIDIIPASDSSTAVIDGTNDYVYGLKTGMLKTEDFAPFIKVNKDDTTKYNYAIEFTKYGVGTCAKINVMAGEKLVKSYTVIIFGDYNGDCVVDSNDLLVLARIAAGTFDSESEAQKFALDLDMDGDIDSFDLITIAKSVAGTIDINQVNPSLS